MRALLCRADRHSAVLLDGAEPPQGAVLFHTLEADGFTTEEISAARMVGQHLGFALGRSTLVARLRAEVERRTAIESELRQAVASAEAGNRAKDDFLAMISHELRAPLTTIVGWVAVLRSGKVPAEGVAKAVASLERNAKLQTAPGRRPHRCLADRHGKAPVRLDRARPAQRRHRCRRRTPWRRRGERRPPDVDVPPHAVPYVGDPQRLQQVVGNLLSNAIKFTPSGRGVEVRMERTAGLIRISVRDHGRGIDWSFLPHIFEAFRQAEVGTTRTHGGLGLGLAIARHLVELHGGAIRAESAGLGLGTMMTVELPLTA